MLGALVVLAVEVLAVEQQMALVAQDYFTFFIRRQL
jgi:hypothetical protein